VIAADRISVVIPALDEAAGIGAAVRAAAAHARRVIVVDGGSRDATPTLAADAGALVVTAPRGRASQMNAGAAVADTDWLLFLHADCRLPEGAAGAIAAASAAGRRWGRFDVRLVSSRPSLAVVGTMMNLRSRATAIATGDQAIFIERGLFGSVGGYAPIRLMEDIELCVRLRRIARPACVPLRVEVSARRWERRGVMRTVLEMWVWRAAYALGASPEWLHRRYYGRR
jgi:rSAM/selenodomain-associated transferase 2